MYLAHHGIKGQKWGVRRYQNEDGTLTPLGRSRERGEATSDASSTVYKRGSGTGSGSQRSRGYYVSRGDIVWDSKNGGVRSEQANKDWRNWKMSSGRDGLSLQPMPKSCGPMPHATKVKSTSSETTVTRSNFGSSEFDVPNESERARERAKKEYEEYRKQTDAILTDYIVPYQDMEFVDIDVFESNPNNHITPDLDGKASSGQATIKQYNDRSKDHTSKSYKDQHSIDTNLNSQLANIQKRDYSEHIHAAVQRGIKEVTSIIRNILTKNKTKTDNKKRK